MTTSFNSAALRKLLIAALSDEDLTRLAYDHFRPVYEQFSAEQSRTRRVQLLVEYCERQKEQERLLTQVKEINPERYAEFALLRHDPDRQGQLAELRARLSQWLRTFQPGPRTYISAACVGAAIGQYAAMGQESIPFALASLGSALGINLLADIIGSQEPPPRLTVDEIADAVQTRLEQGDDLPAVRTLLKELDLTQLALESWAQTSDARPAPD